MRLPWKNPSNVLDRPVNTQLLDLSDGWHYLYVKDVQAARAHGSGAPMLRFYLCKQPDGPYVAVQFMPHLVGRNDAKFFQTLDAYGVTSDLIQSMGLTYREMADAINEAKPMVHALLAYRTIGEHGYYQVRAVQRGLDK